ncbi:unnamed protein product [Prorocentrum cordatum]|uniref:DSBA-like thioredoxin domain-containing protein n=1 Tax=Prorocentrum cordatum TaxID=2364126 RepID=A0ABN9RIX5_9DINO|nr:unnamed protein product [Polarella glacialis]
MSFAAKKVKVEMVADVVCPYCYIGYKHLLDAVKEAQSRNLPVDVEVSYTPFILRRHLPKEGVDKLSVFKQKFGGNEDHARRMLDGVKESATAAGLCMNLEGQRAGNSEDAHRLLLWAKSFGKDMELFESMVKAYNCEQGWLGDHEVLARCAAASDLSEDEARKVLKDPTSSLEVLEAGLKRSERLGVSGVPFFVVDDRQTVPGAEEQAREEPSPSAAAAVLGRRFLTHLPESWLGFSRELVALQFRLVPGAPVPPRGPSACPARGGHRAAQTAGPTPASGVRAAAEGGGKQGPAAAAAEGGGRLEVNGFDPYRLYSDATTSGGWREDRDNWDRRFWRHVGMRITTWSLQEVLQLSGLEDFLLQGQWGLFACVPEVGRGCRGVR